MFFFLQRQRDGRTFIRKIHVRQFNLHVTFNMFNTFLSVAMSNAGYYEYTTKFNPNDELIEYKFIPSRNEL